MMPAPRHLIFTKSTMLPCKIENTYVTLRSNVTYVLFCTAAWVLYRAGQEAIPTPPLTPGVAHPVNAG